MKAEPAQVPMKILLAEDDLDDRIFFINALQEIPVITTLHTVNNGEELMAYLTKNEDRLPDVLFLDLSMPRKTGFECLAEIKANEKFKALTVIMFTTSFTSGIELEDNLKTTLSRMGAQEYIRKPVNFAEYRSVIQDVLTRVREKQGIN